MIISTAGIKGGTGKSMTATSLIALNKSLDCLLVDADKQESSKDWSLVRAQNENIKDSIETIQKTGSLTIGKLKEIADKYELTIIDTPGRASIEFESSMMISDVIVTPFRPAFFDLSTIMELKEKIIHGMTFNQKLKWVVFFNQVTPSSSQFAPAYNLAKQNIDDLGFIYDKPLYSRIAYMDSSNLGLGITEYTDPKAKNEFQELVKFIDKIIQN